MKIIVNKRPTGTGSKQAFVGKRAMGSFSTGVKRSVTVKSHSRSSYVVKPNVIK